VDIVTIGQLLTPKYVVAARKIINGIGRPIITMSDKNTPEDAKRYAATREFSTEMIGLIIILSCGTIFEKIGGNLYAKWLLKRPMTQKEIQKIEKKSLTSLKGDKQKIKAAILLCSFLSTIAEGAVLTPLLNNLILSKFINKILKNKSDKNQAAQLNSLQKKISFKESNIYKKLNNYVEGRSNS